MSEKQVLTVVGATGNQGGSVIDVFLSDPELSSKWQIRAITRDPTKEAGKKLAARGVEVVAADQDDKASLVKAFQGSHTIFAVTDYWAAMDMKKEVQQGKNMADAAHEVGVKHYIWSTLVDVNKVSKGALPHVYHFDGKAQVDEHIRSLGLPASFFLAGFYMTNVSGGMIFRRDPEKNNAFVIALPVPESTLSPYIDTRADTGKFVRGIVKAGTKGQRVLGAIKYSTFRDVLDAFKKVYPEEGAKAVFVELPKNVYQNILETHAGMPAYAAEEMVENFRLLDEFGYYAGESLDEGVALAGGIGELTSLEDHFRNAPEFQGLK